VNFTSTFTSLVFLQLEGGKKIENRKNDNNLYPWTNIGMMKQNSVKCEGHVTCRRSYEKMQNFGLQA